MVDVPAWLASFLPAAARNPQQEDPMAALMGHEVSPEQIFSSNQQYVRSGASGPYSTTLTPLDEKAFRQWVSANNVPFNPDATGPQDYDMRGFYKGLMTGDPHAHTGMNANDGQLHFSDWWKTPYHQSFSAESQWANPATAPRWNDRDQLVTPDGRVVFDERALANPQSNDYYSALLGGMQ